MTGALWAKRGERGISRGARHEGKRKIVSWKIARAALRAKYPVRPAWLIKLLSCRLVLLEFCFLLRFLPKNSTVRPITNMKHCQTNKEPSNFQKPQSINKKLENLFEILKFEKGRNPHNSLRTTLFGGDDLYQVLKPFAERVRKSSDGRQLFFVHVDVNHCYESIPHKKLLDIMEKVLDEEEYLIRRFSLLKMSGGKVHR